jgi:hypothetical protein
MYVGSLLQTDFGEIGDINKGYVAYDHEKDDVVLHCSPHAIHFVDVELGELLKHPDRDVGWW